MTTRMSAEARGRRTAKMKNTRGSAQLLSICQPSHVAMRKVRRFSRQVVAPSDCTAVFMPTISLSQDAIYRAATSLLPAQAEAGLNFRQPFHAPEQDIRRYRKD